jgi:hypothetical protein
MNMPQNFVPTKKLKMLFAEVQVHNDVQDASLIFRFNYLRIFRQVSLLSYSCYTF